MQTTGDFIGTASEFAACVKDGKDRLNGGDAGLGVDLCRHATAIILDSDDVVFVDRHFNPCRISCKSFIDGVVDDLPDQVMQTGG